jgi:transposase-like protein
MAYVDLTLPQFQMRFDSEEACLQAIFAARWSRGFVCPRCNHNGGYRLSGRRTIQCASCRRQLSITSGTIFHRSHLPLKLWFLLIYFVAHDKGGASAMKLSKQLGMHYATTWFVVQKIRFAMATREENLTLAGYIELDEAFFGGKSRNKRTRKGPKRLTQKKKQVLVMVESEGWQAGNLVMKVIDNATWDTLKPIIETKIEAESGGQWFRSDGWQAHDVVMHFGHKIKMGHIPNSLQDQELPCISLAITHAKRSLLGTFHQFCKRHLQRYLDEFAYRWNRRHLTDQLASHLLAACTLCPPVSYATIVQS